MIEREIGLETADGRMRTFVCHPERGDARRPIVVFMDAPGIREELRDMARRLAAVGYYVMLPNLYYRQRDDELGAFQGEAGAPVREVMTALSGSLTIPMVMADFDALLSFIDADPAARPGPIGCVGYCMSGRYALAAATHRGERVAAAASFYGTQLVSDAPDSPHLTAPAAPGELYVAFAEHDEYAPLAMAAPLDAALRAGGARAEVELYPGSQHGFAFPERRMYDKPSAERHWERLFALFGRNLG